MESNDEFINKLKIPVSDIYNNINKKNDINYKEYFAHLMAAIYHTSKKLFPNIALFIPFRIKSDSSYVTNINNVLNKTNIDEDTIKHDIDKDFYGATVVMNGFDSFSSKHFQFSNNPLIIELLEKCNNNMIFLSETEYDLSNRLIMDEKYYYQTKKEILERIIDATYEDFTEEQEIPYKVQLDSLNTYYNNKTDNEYSTTITDTQKEELINLLADLKSRVTDKLEYETVRETIPVVLNDPLIKENFDVEFEVEKDSKKPNGFAAQYLNLRTPIGNIELQLTSKARYDASRSGSASHSEIPGKLPDISHFFEKADPNDKTPLKQYLDILNNIPIDNLIPSSDFPKFKIDKVKQIMKKVKIKDYLYFNNIPIETERYLLKYALSNSPDSFVVSSGHIPSYPSANVTYHSLPTSFRNLLAKKDASTCLGDMLVKYLSDYLQELSDAKEDGISLPHATKYYDRVKDATRISGIYTMSDLISYDVEEKLKDSSLENKMPLLQDDELSL